MRAIIYCRVSSDPHQRGKSVSEQETECREVCHREGWQVADVLVDNDLGASRYSRGQRAAYARLRETLQPGDVLVTWEASRAQRDLAAYLELRDLCVERGVLWSYSGRTHDLSRGDDRFTTGLDALLAEKEVEQSRDRVLRAVRANAAAGKPHGKLAYGYRIIRDPKTGESIGREPDPETAPHVQEMVRRILAGDSIYSICRDFNTRGIPGPRPKRDGTPSEWINVTMRDIAKSPTYAGLRTHRGAVVGPATWPPIIDMEDHERIAALINNPARNTHPHRGNEPVWLLSGIAQCGECGSPMTRVNSRGVQTYMCAGKMWLESKKRHCVARAVHRVEPFVTEAVMRRLEGQELVADIGAGDRGYQDAIDEAKVLQARLDSFADSAAAGELSPTALARIEATLLPQIAAADKRARSLIQVPLVASAMGSGARDYWASLGMRDRRDLVRAVAEVRIHRIGQGRKFYPEGEGIDITWK